MVSVEVEYRTVSGPGDCAVGQPCYPKPLQDAARAVRLVRNMAIELGVSPNRIGVIGFGAGGHLAAKLCSSELVCDNAAEEDLTHISFRPDICILSYPLL